MKSVARFYQELPVIDSPLVELLTTEEHFRTVPQTWHVVITDIVNSTLGVKQGLHQEINLIATGSIIAVLNIAEKSGIAIPFFFGGDGATFIIPPTLLDQCLQALYRHRENTLENFNLNLRVGSIAVGNAYKNNHAFRVARFRMNPFLDIPIVLGDGLRWAEQQIKSSDDHSPTSPNKIELDLSGMECRWNKIRPPRHKDEVVSLLVDVADHNAQGLLFSEVIQKIEEIYGPVTSRHPISVQQLSLEVSLKKIATEMRVKWGETKLLHLWKNWVYTLIGKLYFGKNNSTRQYMENLVKLSDILVIDGRINTIISGTKEQGANLQRALTTLESQGKILFGMHISDESIMSCYVRNRDDRHLHFVDGGNGGYTQAAKMLKEKIKG